MALRQGLRTSQTQRLVLTPGLRQSINILRMSTTELAEHIALEIADNPLLLNDDTPIGPAGDFQFALDTVAQTQTLAEFLQAQIATSKAPKIVQNIAAYLAADLTDAGYIPDDVATISETLGVEIPLIRAAITLLQGLEPTGIGARNLAECLDLQLRARNQPDKTRILLINNLARFARQDWPYLTQVSGRTQAELRHLARVLQSLTPRPAESITPPASENLRPDIQVETDTDGHFTVELINSTAPTLRVDTALAERTAMADANTKAYLRQKTDRANALIRAIEARSKTVLRIAQAIVSHQYGFFLYSHDHLKPLTQQALAQTLDLHPSTVTRAIANKSLNCTKGVFALRFFFPRSLEYLTGDDNISAYAVQLEIRRLVERETPDQILSDGKITTILRESGVDIARRTVAKYRQCLNIPPSVQRRKSKRFL